MIAYAPYALGCAAIFVVSALSDPPIPQALVFQWSDKLLHAAAYAVLAALAWWGARRRGDGARFGAWGPVVVAVVLAAGYGVLDEVHQAFVPNRSPDALDALADLIGAVVGATAIQKLYAS